MRVYILDDRMLQLPPSPRHHCGRAVFSLFFRLVFSPSIKGIIRARRPVHTDNTVLYRKCIFSYIIGQHCARPLPILLLLLYIGSRSVHTV